MTTHVSPDVPKRVSPDVSLPTLSATGLTIYWHPNKTAFDFAALVQNDSGGPVSGPVDVTLGVNYLSGWDGILGSDDFDPFFITGQVDVTVPAGVTLNTGETYRTPYFVDIPFVAMPGEDYGYFAFTVYVVYDGQTVSNFYAPPAPPVPPTPEWYWYNSGTAQEDWWKMQPHFSGRRPESGPVFVPPKTFHP